MINSTISSKGQITIPKKIRDLLKVETSDKIFFIPQEDGKAILTCKHNPASLLFGMLKHRKPAEPISIEKMDSTI